MPDDAHPGWATYDLDRLRANLAEIRRRIGPDQGCIAALKGNAYGHGAVPWRGRSTARGWWRS